MSESSHKRLEKLRCDLQLEYARLTKLIESIPADEIGDYDELKMKRAKIRFQLRRMED